MSKVAYFDLSSGISGDMMLGALLDLGARECVLDDVVGSLGLKGVHLEIEDKSLDVGGKNVKVKYKDQSTRCYKDRLEMIETSTLEPRVKKKSKEILEVLGSAESDIHEIPMEEIELHEVGMVDSIIDIVGTVALFEDLNIYEAYCSTVQFGHGETECQHGHIPVPVPATTNILGGWKTNFTDKRGELVTPTGAALLRVLTEQKPMDDMRLDSVGRGFGDRETSWINALNVFYGKNANIDESVFRIKFYIDDISPEILSHAVEKMRDHSIDIYRSPSIGKKSRSGWEVTVLCTKENLEKLRDMIFRETSTLGFQVDEVERVVQEREIEEIETSWGPVKIKVAEDNVKPEFEDCKKIAEEKGIPLQEVYEKIRAEYSKG